MILSINSFRGGTGKSSVTVNVAALLAAPGKRIAIIDTDIQSPGVHVHFGLDAGRGDKALNDYLLGRCAIEEIAYDVSERAGQGAAVPMKGRLYLIPSSMREGEMARLLRDGYDMGRLSQGLRTLQEKLQLDYLLIDTHPGMNEETLLALTLSDAALIILRPDQKDFQGTAVVVDVARKLDIRHLFLVVNMALSMYDPVEMRKQLEETYKCAVAGILPLSEEVAGLASVGIFGLRYPMHPFAQGIGEIVGRIERLAVK